MTGSHHTGLWRIWAILMAGMAFLSSCNEDVVPKPRGYFRIDLPEKKFVVYQSSCPFEVEVPNYAKVVLKDTTGKADSCRFNLAFPRFNATLYCTYLPVSNNMDELIRDAYMFAAKHELKATALRRTLVEDHDRHVYGIIYDIEGEAASQVQFFFMDSTSHFLRGSLYFDHKPNPDSIAPVLSFLRDDVTHLAKSLRWR